MGRVHPFEPFQGLAHDYLVARSQCVSPFSATEKFSVFVFVIIFSNFKLDWTECDHMGEACHCEADDAVMWRLESFGDFG